MVSVIIPTFNRAGELLSALESVLAQTSPDLEVLVCDDGSTDNTSDAVDAVARRDPRVRYLSLARSGKPAVPRNRGIHAARGRWIAFLDSDDRWAPNKLAVQLTTLSRTGAVACCTNAYRVQNWSLPGHSFVLPPAGANPTQRTLIRRNTVITSSVIVDSTCLRLSGGFPESSSLSVRQDYALWLRIAHLGTWTYVDEPLTHYHDAPQSSIRGEHARSEARGILAVFLDYAVWVSERGERLGFFTRAAMAFRLVAEFLKDFYRLARRTFASPAG